MVALNGGERSGELLFETSYECPDPMSFPSLCKERLHCKGALHFLRPEEKEKPPHLMLWEQKAESWT